MPKTSKTSKKPTGSFVAVPWHPLAAIAVVVVVYFVASILGELVSLIYPIIRGWSLEEGVQWMQNSVFARTVQVIGFYGSMIWLLYLFVKKRGITFAQLGFVAPRLRDLGYALLAVVPYVAGYAVLLSSALALFPSIDTEQEQQLGFNPGGDPLALALTFLCLVILPPIAEELTMRGFLFTSLAGRMRFVWATLITSVIFAIAHLQFDSNAPLLWVAAIDTFVLSLILCYMRYKTGSIWAGVVLHALKNGVAFMSLFVFHLS